MQTNTGTIRQTEDFLPLKRTSKKPVNSSANVDKDEDGGEAPETGQRGTKGIELS